MIRFDWLKKPSSSMLKNCDFLSSESKIFGADDLAQIDPFDVGHFRCDSLIEL